MPEKLCDSDACARGLEICSGTPIKLKWEFKWESRSGGRLNIPIEAKARDVRSHARNVRSAAWRLRQLMNGEN